MEKLKGLWGVGGTVNIEVTPCLSTSSYKMKVFHSADPELSF